MMQKTPDTGWTSGHIDRRPNNRYAVQQLTAMPSASIQFRNSPIRIIRWRRHHLQLMTISEQALAQLRRVFGNPDQIRSVVDTANENAHQFRSAPVGPQANAPRAKIGHEPANKTWSMSAAPWHRPARRPIPSGKTLVTRSHNFMTVCRYCRAKTY